MEGEKTKCPVCEEVQEPNCWVGDVDVCDNCGRQYHQFVNIVREADEED